MSSDTKERRSAVQKRLVNLAVRWQAGELTDEQYLASVKKVKAENAIAEADRRAQVVSAVRKHYDDTFKLESVVKMPRGKVTYRAAVQWASGLVPKILGHLASQHGGDARWVWTVGRDGLPTVRGSTTRGSNHDGPPTEGDRWRIHRDADGKPMCLVAYLTENAYIAFAIEGNKVTLKGEYSSPTRAHEALVGPNQGINSLRKPNLRNANEHTLIEAASAMLTKKYAKTKA